jgi:ferredoxin-type protein NapF
LDPSRRAFFGARRSTKVHAFRPPWAIPERDFLERCSRCDKCIGACPTGLLQKGQGGFPEANFTPGHAPDGCTFCGDCVRSCPDGVLVRQGPDGGELAPWQLTVHFGETCLPQQGVVCRTCGERCDAGAIRFPPRLGGVSHPQLDAQSCTGCAACLADCPTSAITIERLPSHSLAQQGAA